MGRNWSATTSSFPFVDLSPGLDYHDFGPKYNYAKPDLQKSTFVTQINHALNAKKPIIIHTREAEEDTFDLMKQHIPQDWKVRSGVPCVVLNPH